METAPAASEDGIRPTVTPKGKKQGVEFLLRQPIVKTEWIVEDMIAQGEVCAFIGEDGIGKTNLMAELCANILFGAPHFLSAELTLTVKHKRALFISTEDSASKFTNVLRKQITGMYPMLDQATEVPGGFDFLDGEDYASWEDFTKGLDSEIPENYYDVVILDALADVFTFIEGEITNNSDAAFILKHLGHICKVKQTTVIFLHHAAKTKIEEKKKLGRFFLEKNDTLGAGRITSKARTVLGLTNDHGSSNDETDDGATHLNFLHILKSNTASGKWKKSAVALRFTGETLLHNFIDKVRISRLQGNDEAASNLQALRQQNGLVPALMAHMGLVPRNIIPMDIPIEDHRERVGRLFNVQDSFSEEDMATALSFEYKGWPATTITARLIPYLKEKKIISFVNGAWVLDAPPF